jgi:DNA-binding NtrC family response regulator
MQGYDWPGNVRELENLIERAVIVSTGERLMIDLPGGGGAGAASSAQAGGNRGRPAAIAMAGATATATEDDGTPASGSAAAMPVPTNEQERVEMERRMIEQALIACRGKVFGPGGAAERLGLKPTTLASRIKRFGLQKG